MKDVRCDWVTEIRMKLGEMAGGQSLQALPVIAMRRGCGKVVSGK